MAKKTDVLLSRGVITHMVKDIGVHLTRSNQFKGFKLEESPQNLPAALTHPPCDVESIIALGEKEYVLDFCRWAGNGAPRRFGSPRSLGPGALIIWG